MLAALTPTPLSLVCISVCSLLHSQRCIVTIE
jgi:hypothetical protein